MSKIKKVLKVFYSMKTAIVILAILIAVCVIGSLIPQGRTSSYYLSNYSENIGNIILTLQLNRIFSAWWFIALAALLCINLLCCSIIRFPALWRKYRHGYTLQNRSASMEMLSPLTGSPADAKQVLAKLGIKKVEEAEQAGNLYQYAVRRKIGLWGAWLCHLGMLVTIIGFAIGQLYTLDEVVYGIPGQIKPIEGTEYEIRIDDFQIDLREDYTVEQYTSYLTIRNSVTGEAVSGKSMVNAPMGAFGFNLYQNSTGWASMVYAYKDDQLISEQVLCQGEALMLEELPLAIYFAAFYPDYYNDGSGPRTLTPLLNNPQYVFVLYYNNEMFTMGLAGPGDDIQVDSYRFVLQSPAQYTLIQVIKDPSLIYAALGGAILLIGIFLAFYIIPEEILIKVEGEEAMLWVARAKAPDLLKQKVERIFKGEAEDGQTSGS